MGMPLRELEDKLRRKFLFEAGKGTKHESITLIVDGRKVATARLSRGHKTISDSILTMIAREIGVNLGQLKKMCGCTMSREEYLSHMRESGRLT